MFGRGPTDGCRRCSTCSIHYPPALAFEVCSVCDTRTSYFSNIEHDQDWEERVKYAAAHPEPFRDRADPHEHRFEQYLSMGFDLHGAQMLANATWGVPPFPLWHETVRRALAGGCSHALALDLFC